MFPPFLARGNNSTVEDYVAAIDYVISIAGEDNVGIGTDFTQDQDDAFFEYICHDKGYGWRVTGPLGDVVTPAGLRTIGDFPNLTAAMETGGLARDQDPQDYGRELAASPRRRLE
jgi:membrane dipeptidase